MTTTTVRTFTDTEITTAATKATTDPGFWTGRSGEQVSGSDVAAHLDATRALLEKRGWARTPHDPSPELPAVDDSMTVKAILLSLLKAARDLTADHGPLTVDGGLFRAQAQAGDHDTFAVAERVMNALVSARTGSPFVQYTAWAEKRSRTWDDVHDLLTAAASIARTRA